MDCIFYNSCCFCQVYGLFTTENASGDWFGEVSEVDLADVKKEPDDVCCIIYCVFSLPQ